MYREDLEEVFARLEPDKALKNKILERMEEKELNKSSHLGLKGIAAIAACVAIVGISSVFAAGNIISYFQSDKAIDITDMETLSKYNEEIGSAVSNFGYTLTLDNLATDDNFMHVFYTLKKDNMAMTEKDYNNFWFLCRINGKLANLGNHNQEEAYLAENGSYKGVLKLNIADMDVPDMFTFEMYSEPAVLKAESNFEGGYLYQEELTLTDSDKEKLLYVSTTAKKSKVETKSVVKNINKKFSVNYYTDGADGQDIERHGEGEISKVIFSPFGSQLVVKDMCEGYAGMKISGCAVFDENGQSLDVLNTDLNGGRVGVECTNKIEFLKADANTKSLKIVPVKGTCNYNEDKSITQQIGAYPLIYKVNQYGSIVVTDIRFADGKIEIDYYKDGFSQFDPYFQMTDKDGKDAEPGGKLGCLLTTIVHHSTNSYTAKYEYHDECDEVGNKVPFDVSSVSKEKLEQAFTHLTIGAYDFELDYDNAIELNMD